MNVTKNNMKKKQIKSKEIKAWAIMYEKMGFKDQWKIDEKLRYGFLIYRTKKDAENEAYENERVIPVKIIYEI